EGGGMADAAVTGPARQLFSRGRVPNADAVRSDRGDAASVRREGDAEDPAVVALNFLAKRPAGRVPQLQAVAAVGGQRAAVAVEAEGKHLAVVAGQRPRWRLLQVPHAQTAVRAPAEQPAPVRRKRDSPDF